MFSRPDFKPISRNTMHLICINDKGRPAEIPAEKWPKEGENYTPIYYSVHQAQDGILGVQLLEIDLDESNEPYSAFRLSRFALPKKFEEEFLELGRMSHKMDKALEWKDIPVEQRPVLV